MEILAAAAVGLLGLAYAIGQGRHARRPDLSDAEKADVRRTRERAVVWLKTTTVTMCLLAALSLVLGAPLAALVAIPVAALGWWTTRHVQRLIDE